MKEIPNEKQQYLEKVFAERINFDPRERRFYTSDVGTMPKMMQGFAGDNFPAGIVQPVSEEELSLLAAWAQQNKVPLVPRGKATSGYGGVVPARGGLVVEFNRMKKILEINPGKQMVTVEPGVVWEKLEQELSSKGLTLNSYPTSAPASTVGGWLATGGAGIGSYQAGYFRDNVVEINMVYPDGKKEVLKGEDLDLADNTSGITGFISQITFRVSKLQPLEKKAIAFDNFKQLADFINEVYRQDVTLWSLSFVNPAVTAYRNKMPVKGEHGHSGEHIKVDVPEKFIVTAVYHESAAIEEKLITLAASSGGQILENAIAEHEWEERFSPMKAKRISPSLIPAEVVIPATALEKVLTQLSDKIKQPFLLEGFGVKGGDIVLLGFIPHDERKFGFNVAFGLSLTVLKAALNNGGRAYGCGLYFSGLARELIGDEAIKKIESNKKEHDPAGIMNPGKTLQTEKIARMISMALPFESMVSTFANMFAGNPPGEIHREQKGLPGDISWLSYACAGCGYCVDECTQYYGRGWESHSPRGKWRLLKMVADGETTLTQQDISTFVACTTCEICNERCQLEMPIEPSWFKLRGDLIHEKGYHSLPAFHIMEASANKEWNIWAHYSADRDKWLTDDIREHIKDKAEIAYFPGCTASFVEQDIAQSTASLLDKAGIEYTYLGKEEACCGIPMLMAGRWDTFEKIMDHNIEGMKRHGATTVITSCPACRLVWDTFYRRWMEDRGEEYPFKAMHYSEVIAEKIADGSFKPDKEITGTITYHDPCHMGRAAGIYEEPRALLKAIPGVEFRDMKYNRDKAHCCGSVMSLVADPDAAGRIGKVRLDDAVEAGADTIITACPCCRVQLKVAVDYNGMQDSIKVKDLAAFVADACGFEIPDSTSEIDESWAIFDIMIRMMTPKGMAEMMAEMLDDLIDAMPGPMPAMMKWLKKQGSTVKTPAIAMMQPIMPKLFPMLLPGMMPKVMPKMLEMVKKKVPMPDFMQEQMPDLMPPAMVELMPKMLPDIIPHFMPFMVEYLKNSSNYRCAAENS